MPMKNNKGCFPARYVFVILAHFGTLTAYMVRFNLSVALVAMVKNTGSNDVNTTSDDCPDLSTSNYTHSNELQGEFDWNSELQGTVLASFYYGYVITQIPGGLLAGKFGGKWLVGLSVLGMSFLTLLTPLAAGSGAGYLIATRALMGLFGGIYYPGMHSMLGRWAPVWERTRMSAITYSGAGLGIVLTFPITGLLCQYGFAGGWPSAFYTMGSLGCLWFVVWSFAVFSSPSEHPRISDNEKNYILQSIGQWKKSSHPPWREVLTSRPLWALLVAGTCSTYGVYTMLTCLPSYMKEVLRLDITQNGFLSAVPYIAGFLSYSLNGFLADFLRTRGILTTTQTRKLFITLGTITTSSAFVVITFIGCDRTGVIALLVLGVAAGSMYSMSSDVNTIDLAPNYAGQLMGLTNMTQNLAGIVSPFIVGVITNEQQNRKTWGKVFYLTAGVYAFGMIFYNIFGSGAVQKWAAPPGLEQSLDIKPGERTPLLNSENSSVQTVTVKR